mmetsp:Transcript_25930/g.52012  ORF Transcript_25930/g.52012 Transcript_25930/m.52012 type:complete len:213 (+) Transcript_25930:224-862(+)
MQVLALSLAVARQLTPVPLPLLRPGLQGRRQNPPHMRRALPPAIGRRRAGWHLVVVGARVVLRHVLHRRCHGVLLCEVAIGAGRVEVAGAGAHVGERKEHRGVHSELEAERTRLTAVQQRLNLLRANLRLTARQHDCVSQQSVSQRAMQVWRDASVCWEFHVCFFCELRLRSLKCSDRERRAIHGLERIARGPALIRRQARRMVEGRGGHWQ